MGTTVVADHQGSPVRVALNKPVFGWLERER